MCGAAADRDGNQPGRHRGGRRQVYRVQLLPLLAPLHPACGSASQIRHFGAGHAAGRTGMVPSLHAGDSGPAGCRACASGCLCALDACSNLVAASQVQLNCGAPDGARAVVHWERWPSATPAPRTTRARPAPSPALPRPRSIKYGHRHAPQRAGAERPAPGGAPGGGSRCGDRREARRAQPAGQRSLPGCRAGGLWEGD